MLAYHVYNQSLIWPLDPWYEAWSRIGSSRRDNTLAHAHELAAGQSHLRGPGSTRGWPSTPGLDPVIADYRQVRPWAGCVMNDGVDHRYFSAHDEIVGAVASIQVCEYSDNVQGRPTSPQLLEPVINPTAGLDAADRVYTFEGATGSIDGEPPAWSLMGIVLERAVEADGYDIHIAYRGSQSGDAYRAAYQGLVLEEGNPDWVTDMEIRKMVDDHRFSTVGSMVLGFRDSVLSSFGTLVECLVDIAERRGSAPRAIHIGGHSLGGALAVQLAAALTVGNLAKTLPEPLREWPWPELELRTFGSPKAGDGAFADNFDDVVSARRIWVDGDPITEFPLNQHIGTPVPLQSGLSGTINHEPFVIRQSMVESITWNHPDAEHPSWLDHEPWQAFENLGQVLLAAEANGESLTALFNGEPSPHIDLFVELAGRVVATASSYRIPFTKPRRERERRQRQLHNLFATRVDSLDALSVHLKKFRGVQPTSEIENHLRRVYMLREASRNGWTTNQLLDDAYLARTLGTFRHPMPTDGDAERTVSIALGPPPNQRDIARVNALIWMRQKHHETVNDGSVDGFRRRVPPTSGMPHLVRACGFFPGLEWLPKELLVPTTIPDEAQLVTGYKAKYYGLGKLGWDLYARSPIRPEVPWRPEYEWNAAFPGTGDGWEHPTSDETYTRLRLQGPNPFMLQQTDDGFELDFSELFDGVFPPIRATFDLVDDTLAPRDITIGTFVHRPGDPTWDRAKRVVNAADIRSIPFVRHLLDVHFIVGQAFAVSAYSLPTWHKLRPFMHFFSFGTIQVNDFAYRAFFTPSSYFIASGFMTGEAAASLFANRVAAFDLDEWIVPKDIAKRGIGNIPRHPYVEDAQLIWPEFMALVERHLDELGLDDDVIAADPDLQIWYLTLAKMIPNMSAADVPLDRQRLVELCAAFLYNNVVHEICGDMSPILGSNDPDDKAVVNLDKLAAAIGDGSLTTPLPAPSMADVFLMDQASYTSRFNVGGNKISDINASRWVDDPKLADAIVDLQTTLVRLEAQLVAHNDARAVRYSRMLPENWEASISF